MFVTPGADGVTVTPPAPSVSAGSQMDGSAGGRGQTDPLALHLGLGLAAGKQEVWRVEPWPCMDLLRDLGTIAVPP